MEKYVSNNLYTYLMIKQQEILIIIITYIYFYYCGRYRTVICFNCRNVSIQRTVYNSYCCKNMSILGNWDYYYY